MNALARKWRIEAERHEAQAREIENSTCDYEGTEESAIHREVADTLRKCAADLWADETVSLLSTLRTMGNPYPYGSEGFTAFEECRNIAFGRCKCGGGRNGHADACDVNEIKF